MSWRGTASISDYRVYGNRYEDRSRKALLQLITIALNYYLDNKI